MASDPVERLLRRLNNVPTGSTGWTARDSAMRQKEVTAEGVARATKFEREMVTTSRLGKVPQELKDQPNWLCWQYRMRGNKPTKVPYDAETGTLASSTDPETWTTFARALKAFLSNTDYAGVGCVIQPPYVGIDLDKCRDPQTGQIDQRWRTQVINLKSYAELTPSKTGIHVWVKWLGMPAFGSKRDGIEIYTSGRFFTVTGMHLSGTPLAVNEVDLMPFYKKFILAADGQPATKPVDTSPSAHEWRIACQVWRDLGTDAAYEEAKLEFFSRAEYRDKWHRNRSYIDRTLTKAREHVSRYEPGAILSAQPMGGVRAERIPRFRTAAEIATTTPETVEWIAAPWVAAGSTTEVAAKVKVGKTTWIMHMVAAVLDGKRFMGEPTTKSPVVYLTEQPVSSLREVLARAGLLERQDLHLLLWNDTIGWSWPDVVRIAVEQCKLRGAKLLVIDTIAQFAKLQGDAENNAGDALLAMEPLQEAAASGLGVIVVRHERKSGGDVGDSGRGSSAFAGAVDTVISIRRPEGNTRRTLRVIHALSRFSETPEETMIELTDQGYVSRGSVEDVAAEEARRLILAESPRSPEKGWTLEKLVKKLDARKITRTTAQRAINRLLHAGQLARVGKGRKGDPYRFWVQAEDSAQTQGTDGRKQSAIPQSRRPTTIPGDVPETAKARKIREAEEVLARWSARASGIRW